MERPTLSAEAAEIKAAVLSALQDAEELGGVVDDNDYLLLMHELREEISQRIKACSEALRSKE